MLKMISESANIFKTHWKYSELMEEHGLKQSDLSGIGNLGVVSEILSGNVN